MALGDRRVTGQPPRTFHMDPTRLADLGNGWRATVCVGPDGAESLWLASPTPDLGAGCACAACAPHEQSGRPLASGPASRVEEAQQ
jgi:hypothetical protein